MKKTFVAAAALLATCGVAMAAGPFDGMKGKMKEGLYEYKMDMEMPDMPNMPKGMGKHTQTVQRCVTSKDLDEGNFARGPQHKQDCEFQDTKFSGNSGSYRMVCKGANPMTADVKMGFRDNGFTSDMDMTMSQGGQQMHMKQHMEGKYLGPCK